MKAFWFVHLITSCLALRLLTLGKMVSPTGDMGGIASAAALCRASARSLAVPSTTWIPLLETTPTSLQTIVASYGPSVYPINDASRNGIVIAQTNLFAPSGITNTL